MDPVTALRQIAYYKDRNRHDPRRVMAYRNAADIIEGLDDAARQRHGQANSWQSLAGIGPKTAKVIAQAWSGREPDLLAELRADAEDLGGGAIRAALRGACAPVTADRDRRQSWHPARIEVRCRGGVHRLP